MTDETDCFNISSTYAVLGDDGGVIPVAVSDSFFEDLEDQSHGSLKLIGVSEMLRKQ